ncbi:hypothetical protein F2Q69_00059342 [Brassica cretica]|uniref:Uncharacterized protein n=1 Tax=Brassica cretica TaxID=69181 RepID=A0A8S9RIF5_BRACR|nr:hypothetical protein F2Q69_00059342 [Brassica cretica]
MPSSTGSNKETQLIFSSDPASLERSIRKEIRSSSIDNNTSSSIDSRQPPSTQTPVSSTDTRSSPSTEDTPLPSIDTFHPISIDTSVRTSIDTEPRDMVATLILVLDERGDLHDQEGHLRNAAGQRIDAQGSSQDQKPYSNNYNNNMGYRNSYYHKPLPPTQESKIEEMLDRVLEGQQRMTVVHAQQYRKQQGNSTDILIRSCKLGTFNPQGNTFLIDRQQHKFIDRFSSATVDPNTSLVDRHSLVAIDRRHSSYVDRHLPSDIDRHFSPNIDRY